MSKKGEDQKLLDTFAAAALQGISANSDMRNYTYVSLVAIAYDFAEYMLAERRKRMEGKK